MTVTSEGPVRLERYRKLVADLGRDVPTTRSKSVPVTSRPLPPRMRLSDARSMRQQPVDVSLQIRGVSVLKQSRSSSRLSARSIPLLEPLGRSGIASSRRHLISESIRAAPIALSPLGLDSDLSPALAKEVSSFQTDQLALGEDLPEQYLPNEQTDLESLLQEQRMVNEELRKLILS
jgi:hypothetical protein